MFVTALCTACFFRAKINKKLWPPYFKIRPPYFEYSGAGSDERTRNLLSKLLMKK